MHEQHNVELTFVKDPVQITISSVKIICQKSNIYIQKMYKKLSLESNIYLKYVDICQGYLPPIKKNRKRQSIGRETYQQEDDDKSMYTIILE